jgi:hypothetical protein
MMPLFVEAALLAMAGFSAGLLIAFVAARRRHRKG